MIKIKYGRLIDSYLVTYIFGPFTLFGKAIHVSKVSKLTCWKQDIRELLKSKFVHIECLVVL